MNQNNSYFQSKQYIEYVYMTKFFMKFSSIWNKL